MLLTNLFNSVPGKGGRTVASIVLLVLVTLGNNAGLGEESLSPELVDAVKVILLGAIAIFYRLK